MILNWIYNWLWHVSDPINVSGWDSVEYDAFHWRFHISFHAVTCRCRLLFFGFIDSHSHSILHDAIFYLAFPSHQLCIRRWRASRKSSRQTRELEVFSFIPVINRENAKPSNGSRKCAEQKTYSISPCIHMTPDKEDNVHQTMLFVFYYTPVFDVSEYDMEKWIMLMIFTLLLLQNTVSPSSLTRPREIRLQSTSRMEFFVAIFGLHKMCNNLKVCAAENAF